MPAKKYFTADKRQDGVVSNLNQVIDVIQEDISGSATRRKYQTFVTGGIGPGVTSSLYQTVYDQDFTLQTANSVLDMTVGLFHDDVNGTPRDNLVVAETGYNKSGNNQLLFDTKSTLMMREKINIYRQYAKLLLGDADLPFACNVDSPTLPKNDPVTGQTSADWKTSTKIFDACLFINIKRLFARDQIRKETFALRLYENAPDWFKNNGANMNTVLTDGVYYWQWDYDEFAGTDNANTASSYTRESAQASDQLNAQANLFGTDVSSSTKGVKIIADIGASATNYSNSQSGQWAYLKHAADTDQVVGMIFYEAGILVLNLGGSTRASGSWGQGQSSAEALRYSPDPNGENGDGGEGQNQNGANGAIIRPIFSPRDRINALMSGMIDAHHSNGTNLSTDWGNVASPPVAGQVFMGFADAGYQGSTANTQAGTNQNGPQMNPTARFYPDLLVSASIDDIVDHIGYTRFSSGSLTATAFQNVTTVNSSIFFCRATASQFNGSNNPTFADPADPTKWLLDGSGSSPFTYITTVLLYDDEDEIVAIAKLNRPIEKNNQSELTIRVRLDF